MYALSPAPRSAATRTPGIGRENGPEGIAAYTEAKSVLLPFGYTPEV